MNDRARFSEALLKAMFESLLPAIEERELEMAEALRNHLFNLDGPHYLGVDDIAHGDTYRTLYWAVSEIDRSFESLLDAEPYVRRFPYGGTRITRVRHLRYVVENYLQEVYIIKERLKAFLNAVEALYKDSQSPRIGTITQSLSKSNAAFFREIIAVRGSHVHRVRHYDQDLQRLESVEHLMRYTEIGDSLREPLKHLFSFEYSRIREERRRFIVTANKAIERILEENFSQVVSVILDDGGNLIFS